MALYSETKRRAVISNAVAAVTARVRGKTAVRLGSGATAQTLDLVAGGWCNRFVRQCFETALGIGAFSWYFGAGRACETLEKLEPYRVPLKDRRPGDILGFATPKAGDSEHIAIYLGREYDPAKELVAENTSAVRGDPRLPGTKVTAYSALRSRVTGCYRLFV